MDPVKQEAREERHDGSACARRPGQAGVHRGRAQRLWLIGITEHSTGEGKLHRCAIKDVFANRIVGYSIDSRMKSRLAVAALDSAAARRAGQSGGIGGRIVHSDRGSQFRSRKFVAALGRHDPGSNGPTAGDDAGPDSAD